MSFEVAFHHAVEHGVISGITLPDSPEPVPDEVLDQLHPVERAYASHLTGYRQVSFTGGRLAARAAASQLGHLLPPVLPDDRGTPVWPRGVTGSISHKRRLAVCLLARDRGQRLGVDLEEYEPMRSSIEPKVLTDEELADIAKLTGERRWIATLQRFSIKEAIYKAVDPHVRRYVGFKEAMVRPDRRGSAYVRLDLRHGEGPFRAEANYTWLHGYLLATVSLRPGRPLPPPDPQGVDAD